MLFLDKCTSINAGFGEGWLAYGHSLYYVDEHEQAMNCYLRVCAKFGDLLIIFFSYSLNA
jgi:hypothetical protein